MQSLERILAAPAVNHEGAPPRENKYDRPALDDFGRLMQRALAPKQKDSPREAALRAGKHDPVAVKNPAGPEKSSPVSMEKKNAGKDAAAVGESEKPAGRTSAEQNFKTSDNPVIPGQEAPPAPPVLLSLPLAGNFISPVLPAEISAPGKNIPAVTTVLTVDNTGSATSVAAANTKSEKAAAEKSNSLGAELAASNPVAISTPQKSEPAKNEAAAAANGLLKNSAAAEMTKAMLSAEPAQKTTELAAAVSAVPAVENAGTGVAIGEVPMKNNANTNKVAGLAGTVLPGDAALSAREKVLPALAPAGPVRAAESNSADAAINLSMSGTVGAVDFSPAQSALILPALTDARLRNLERTHDMVALHAVRLVQAQTDTLSVVIKPGAGTELSLELRQRNGGIEAHAVLSRGDFQLMNQHWPELQQRLEQRGIKLAALGGEASFSTDSGSNFKQQQQPSSREAAAQQASAFAEFALAGRTLGATARLVVGGGGWESWA